MMVPRIGFCLVFLVVFAGFTPPTLPKQSKGTYRFEKPVDDAGDGSFAVKTREGGVFSVAVGFKRAVHAGLARGAHRERAEDLLKRLTPALKKLERRGVEVSVASIYAPTREVILNVVVSESDELDAVRYELLNKLKSHPGVAFAGEAGKAQIE